MDRYYGTSTRAGASGRTGSSDRSTLTTAGSASGSVSWPDSLIRTRDPRLTTMQASPPTSAFLTPAFNACASATSDVDPALIRLPRSRGPLRFSSSSSDSSSHWAKRRLVQMSSPAGKANPPAFRSPLKVVAVEEDVLVMDGVLVTEPRSPNIRRSYNSAAESGTSSGSGGGSYKTEMCWLWEERGSCRNGSRCQFAHGKEEVRSDQREARPWKQKKDEILEDPVIKALPSSETPPFGSSKPHRCFTLQGPTSPDSAPTEKILTNGTAETSPPTIPASEPPLPPQLPPTSTFVWPPTDEEEAVITNILYGLSSKRRLPVFEQICPK